MSFDAFAARTIDKVIEAEKGYVNDPDDNGGETNWGITIAVARRYGYLGPMRELPQSVAREIYRRRYIIDPAFDRVAMRSEKLAEELVDTGVNMGPSRAAEMLQRWLNGFNDRGSKYADLFVDGRIGKVTLEALDAYLAWRDTEGERVLLMALNCAQGMRYLDIAEGNPSQEKFLYGWMRARVANILEV